MAAMNRLDAGSKENAGRTSITILVLGDGASQRRNCWFWMPVEEVLHILVLYRLVKFEKQLKLLLSYFARLYHHVFEKLSFALKHTFARLLLTPLFEYSLTSQQRELESLL